MATCYICGAPNADYRREVSTGHSTGWYFGKRISSSFRSYYSKKSVCAACAKQIDENSGSGFLPIILIAVIIGAIYFISSNSNSNNASQSGTTSSANKSIHATGNSGRIISIKGLNIRTEPNSASEVLITIPYNETVTILSTSKQSETIADRTGHWYKVEYNGTKGWVFSSFVQLN